MTQKPTIKDFTNLTEKGILNSSIFDVLVPLQLIAFEYNLRLNWAKEFKIAKKILINSVKYN
jgi:hypothetical protein